MSDSDGSKKSIFTYSLIAHNRDEIFNLRLALRKRNHVPPDEAQPGNVSLQQAVRNQIHGPTKRGQARRECQPPTGSGISKSRTRLSSITKVECQPPIRSKKSTHFLIKHNILTSSVS